MTYIIPGDGSTSLYCETHRRYYEPTCPAALTAPAPERGSDRAVIEALLREFHCYDDHREDGFGATPGVCVEYTCRYARLAAPGDAG